MCCVPRQCFIRCCSSRPDPRLRGSQSLQDELRTYLLLLLYTKQTVDFWRWMAMFTMWREGGIDNQGRWKSKRWTKWYREIKVKPVLKMLSEQLQQWIEWQVDNGWSSDGRCWIGSGLKEWGDNLCNLVVWIHLFFVKQLLGATNIFAHV